MEPPAALLERCPLPVLARDPALDMLALASRVLECDGRAAGLIAWRDELRGRQEPEPHERPFWRVWE